MIPRFISALCFVLLVIGCGTIQAQSSNEPSFAPPWPEPPVVTELAEDVVSAATVRREQLSIDAFTSIVPGADPSDAALLPLDTVVGTRFLDTQRYHIYLLQPPQDDTQLTELLVWTEAPKKIKMELVDLVDNIDGAKLMSRSAGVPMSRLSIQKPTLLYLSKSKGESDYKLLWRTTNKLEAGLEHEPNSTRTTNPELINTLPHMQKVTENEYAFSGYLGEQDKADYFVIDSDTAAVVTLEASAGKLGIYVGNKDYKSHVFEKRIFLSDILILPGKNVFYIYSVKGDYSIKATASPLGGQFHEQEPNDATYLAHRLELGQERTGRLPVARDSDYYFFNWQTKGSVSLMAVAGEGGDVALKLYKGDEALMIFAAAQRISENVTLEPGAYNVQVTTKTPSLQPYTIKVDVEKPVVKTADLPSPALSLVVNADTNVVQPFSNKGQIIHASLDVLNNTGESVKVHLTGRSSHDGILIDLPDTSYEVASNGSANVAFDLRIRRLVHAFGSVPLDFIASVDGEPMASVRWGVSFPYDAPLTQSVWHDQPLPAVFMGAFDVARTDFGALPHRDVSCHCTEKLSSSGRVKGTDVYRSDSALCPSAVHAGRIPKQGGVIRVVSTDGLDTYVASTANDVTSFAGKKGSSSFIFLDPANRDSDDISDCAKTLDLKHNGLNHLFDGLSFRSYYKGPAATVNLVGEKPVALTGVVLGLRGAVKHQAKSFEIDTSVDGVEFATVYAGELRQHEHDQAFVFDAPVVASHLRVRLLDGFNDVAPDDLRLAMVKVMAVKDGKSDLEQSFNLADAAFGAHEFNSEAGETILSFHHNRTALIKEIQIESKERKLTTTVSVESSVYGPYGPWTVVANDQIEPKSTLTLNTGEPVKAKYIRVTGNWPKAKALSIKSVLEVESGNGYRSILAEWGNQEADAYFELGVQPESNAAPSRITSSPDNPIVAKPGDRFNSSVSLQDNFSDYYKIVVPPNTLSMQLRFTGDPLLRTRIDVTDVVGNAIDYIEDKPSGGHSLTITVAPLLDVESFYVKVYDTPKYLGILWDDSGSVSPYVPGLHRMIRNFAFEVDPRFEKLNLSSLREKKPQFLLDDWANSSFDILGAIRSYTNTGSSAAYINMEYALSKLDEVDGIKALLIMTDEQGDRNRYKDNKMEKLLSASGAVIFSFHATSSNKLHDKNSDHMQTWADIGAGRYTLIRSEDEVPDAIAKVQTWLRKTAVYQLNITALSNTPGSLTVSNAKVVVDKPAVISSGAVEVILDASGSMWKKMADGQPRITVAKNVLTELVAQKLPEHTPFALRVFGHKQAKSCRTDLAIPFGPLARAKTIKKIKSINPQDRSKTPIGDSLKAVTKDLRKADGKRIVILITDGEETCDADPKAVIADLRAQGFDVQVNIVGFAIDDNALKESFAQWAEIGGGEYFDTNDSQQLINSLQESLTPQYIVRNLAGETVAQGRLGGPSVELLPGDYTVALSVEGYVDKTVSVQPGGHASVSF